MGIFDAFANLGATLATNQANQRLTELSWTRDDNAVQRRSADMLKAGFNPVLAAGAAAQNASPIPMHAPDLTGADPSSIQTMMRQNADISKTAAEQKLIETQASKAQVEKDQAQWQLDYAKKMGIPTTSFGGPSLAPVLYGADTLGQLGNALGNAAGPLLKKVGEAAIEEGQKIKAQGFGPWLQEKWKSLTGQDKP